MRALEGSWDARSVYTKKTNTTTLDLIPQEDSETIIPTPPRLPNNYVSGFEAIRIRRAFEDDLEASRVYTRAALYDFCDRSFVSSAIRTNAWSILSLSDISVISVLALPLFQGDISNQEHYSFGDIDAAQVLGSAALRTIGQSLAQSELPPSTVSSAGERDDTVLAQSAEPNVSSTSRDADNTTPLLKDDGHDEQYAHNTYLCKGCGKLGDDNDDLLMFSKSLPSRTVNIHSNPLPQKETNGMYSASSTRTPTAQSAHTSGPLSSPTAYASALDACGAASARGASTQKKSPTCRSSNSYTACRVSAPSLPPCVPVRPKPTAPDRPASRERQVQWTVLRASRRQKANGRRRTRTSSRRSSTRSTTSAYRNRSFGAPPLPDSYSRFDGKQACTDELHVFRFLKFKTLHSLTLAYSDSPSFLFGRQDRDEFEAGCSRRGTWIPTRSDHRAASACV
jgi:hypothetical protein